MTTNHETTAPQRRLGELAALRFPLLPRRKPACPSLIDRIGRVRHRANPAQGRPDESLVRAAEAHNLAALILSDCAMPEPARALCWRQFDLFATAGPYRQNTAKLALQPLINLGRLHTRDGDGHAAYQLHHAMFQAAKTRTTATIDNRPVDLAAVVAPGDDHTAIVGWLWTILLADGLRALCRAGRWPEAHAQAEHHHGIGERPLDGRQIAIIAHATAGDNDQALRLIDATAAPAGWEQAIVACLAVFCRTWAGLPTPAASEAMVRSYLGWKVSRRRKILNTAVEYAVELGLLASNPVPALKWKAPKSVLVVDRRAVANPVQVRTLLDALREQPRSGPRLVAFFGCLYYAAMRPEEAVALTKRNLALPAEGWGEFHLEAAEPHAGKEWTDSGKNRDQRQLKQRERGETRTVPCPPELTALIHLHIEQFGTAPDGRLFTGERNHGELPKLTIVRAWKRAREEVFTPEVAATPLAGTPYDLRHAAVSTWLNGGVPPTDVAAWAGHSVEILLKIYAKCLDGGQEQLRQRVQTALGY